VLTLLLPAALAQTLPAGDPVTDAARLQLTQQGLIATADLGTEILPTDPFPIPTLSGGDLGGSFPGCLIDYGYDISNGSVRVEVISASIVPSNGVLTLQSQLLVTVNQPLDPMLLLLGAACIEGDCNAWVDPFVVDLEAPVSLSVVGGAVVADIGTVSFTDDLVGDDVTVQDCTAADIINLVSVVYNPYDLVVDYARGQVSDLLPGFVDDFELAINDALAVASFSDQFDLLGTTLFVDFGPEALSITPEGVDIQLNGRIAADPHPCVAPYDTGGSQLTSGPAPGLSTLNPSTQVGVQIASDIVDQGLYAFWRGGLLCVDLQGGELGGFTLDTNLLGLIGGDAYGELYPDTSPLIVRTTPSQPPVTVASNTNDLAVEVTDLGIDFYAELDGRIAHALGLGLSPEVGLDVNFDDTSGALAVDIALPTAYNATLRGDPMVPDAESVIGDVENVIATLAETAITGALGDSLAFDLPTFAAPSGANIGLSELSITASGAGWTTAEASIGPVSYVSAAGCDQGCQGSGCNTPGVPFSWGMGLFVLIGLRRRL